MYSEKFRLRNHLSTRIFINLIIGLRGTGCLKEQECGHAEIPVQPEML